MSKFLPFEEALVVARSLKLASMREWYMWCKEGMRPTYLPSNPRQAYKDAGWQGWVHWLGTSNQGKPTVPFLPFAEALVVARSLNLASSTEWSVWCKEGMRPAYLPASPNQTYKESGWQGWVHWLGSSGITKPSKFAPFGQALAFAQSLGLASQKEWKVWCKEGRRPANVPSDPCKTYKGAGWQGWVHWLGSSDLKPPSIGITKASKFGPFDQALAFARSLGLASKAEWKLWCKRGMRPVTVPSGPDQTYKDGGWQGWVHWLGSSDIKKPSKPAQFLPFAQALAVMQSLGLGSQKEWHAWCKAGKRPATVPSNPHTFYKDAGWQGYGHWLGTGNTRNTTPFLPFAEALDVARSLNLASKMEWSVWCKEGMRPAYLPSTPNQTYKDGGWQGWGHWLGTGNIKRGTQQFLDFYEALLVARALRLTSSTEWRAWCKSGARPANVPANPEQVYVHDGWMGYTHWLCHANLDPPAAPAAAQPPRKRAAPTGTCSTVDRSQGKRRRR